MSDYNIDKEKMLVRLHRVCGQVHAVENMVEKGEDYNNILMQLSASTAALRAVALIVAHQEISKAKKRCWFACIEYVGKFTLLKIWLKKGKTTTTFLCNFLHLRQLLGQLRL